MTDPLRCLAALAPLIAGAVQSGPGAQDVPPPRSEESFVGAYRLDRLRDLDGDGVDELVVGCPHAPGTRADAGVVFVISGKSAETIHALEAPGEVDRFGLGVASLPDVDGDGLADFAVAGQRGEDAGRSYVVMTYSGERAAPLWSRELVESGRWFGSLSSIADRDGDGLADVVVSAYSEDLRYERCGAVQILSSATGDTLQVVRPPGVNVVDFGKSVVGVPDVNGDDVDDLVIVARYLVDPLARGYLERQRSRRSWAGIYSGRDGAFMGPPAGIGPFTEVFRAYPLDDGEAIVLSILNADSREWPLSDLVTELRWRWEDGVNPASGLLCQTASDPAVRWSLPGVGSTGFCEVGDVDGDGVSDFAAGAPHDVLAGEFNVFSVERQGILFSLGGLGTGLGDVDHFGSELCPIGDFDADGVPDLCVASETYYGRHGAPPSRLGWVSVGRGELVRFLQVEGNRALRFPPFK